MEPEKPEHNSYGYTVPHGSGGVVFGVSNASSPMPTSSLQQTNAAAAISALAISAPAPNEMALADNHVAALLVTVTFAVASVVFVSAPVAGVAEEPVCAAAMRRARDIARRAGVVMARWAPGGC